jgi:hypothetical protein
MIDRMPDPRFSTVFVFGFEAEMRLGRVMMDSRSKLTFPPSFPLASFTLSRDEAYGTQTYNSEENDISPRASAMKRKLYQKVEKVSSQTRSMPAGVDRFVAYKEKPPAKEIIRNSAETRLRRLDYPLLPFVTLPKTRVEFALPGILQQPSALSDANLRPCFRDWPGIWVLGATTIDGCPAGVSSSEENGRFGNFNTSLLATSPGFFVL